MSVWVQNPHILNRPKTLEQCLALEHFWLKPCTAWMCTQIREHIAPLRIHAATVMNELGEIVLHCTDFALTATTSVLQEGKTLLEQTQERVAQFLEEIRDHTK